MRLTKPFHPVLLLFCLFSLTLCGPDNPDVSTQQPPQQEQQPQKEGNEGNEEEQDQPVAVTGISLNKTTLILTEGESEQLSAAVSPDNAADKTVFWSSSVPEVASVQEGMVTAIKEGTATITAKAGDKTATCEVTVQRQGTTQGEGDTEDFGNEENDW